MHEMSLCEGVIQIIEEQATEQNFSKVKSVCLEVGQLAGVEIEALKFCFEVVCRGTIANDAKLEIEKLAGQAWCLQCANAIQVTERYAACEKCGSYQLQITGGDEMRVKELEVE